MKIFLKRLAFLITIILCSSLSYLKAEEVSSKEKELETKIELLKKELEIEKLKKELEEQKKANQNNQNDKESQNKELSANKPKISNETIKIENDLEKEIINQISLLGKFEEPKKYPSGFIEMFLKRGCKTWYCLNQKTSNAMSLIFKRTENYNLRNPGNQIRGMALFEIFYLNTLKKNESKIDDFLKIWPKDNNNSDAVIRMIKLNKSREKMRVALGMDLTTPIEEVLNNYWVMSEFLDLGTPKKQKISNDIIVRKNFLENYKKQVNNLNSLLKKNKDNQMYDYIKNKS